MAGIFFMEPRMLYFMLDKPWSDMLVVWNPLTLTQKCFFIKKETDCLMLRSFSNVDKYELQNKGW